jgi:hypothetical protein
VEEVKGHVFFEGIDWEALLGRRVTPPFNPMRRQRRRAAKREMEGGGGGGAGDPGGGGGARTSGDTDTGNFESEFTALPLYSLEKSGGVLDGESRLRSQSEQQKEQQEQQQQQQQHQQQTSQEQAAAAGWEEDGTEEPEEFANFTYDATRARARFLHEAADDEDD